MLTIDNVLDSAKMKALMSSQDNPGKPLGFRVRNNDGKVYDTSGGFLVGELERLDQTMHLPLSSVSWDRDLPIRDDVTVGDDVSSFTQSSYATPSGPGTGSVIGQKRSVIGKITNEIAETNVDIGKVTVPLLPWGQGISYSLPELASAAQLGRPIDQQKVLALNADYQLQMDAQAYLGWSGNGTFGLINNTSQVTPTNFPATGTGSSSTWPSKTPAQILTDLASLVYAPWAASGFAVKPNRVLLDPSNYNYIRITNVSSAGSKSILQYFLDSYNANPNDEPLQVLPLKWLTGAGAGGTLMQQGTTNRAVAYHKEENWQQAQVRFPMTMLQRTPIQYDGLFHKFYFWGRMGACEFVYPETVVYFDGN